MYPFFIPVMSRKAVRIIIAAKKVIAPLFRHSFAAVIIPVADSSALTPSLFSAHCLSVGSRLIWIWIIAASHAVSAAE